MIFIRLNMELKKQISIIVDPPFLFLFFFRVMQWRIFSKNLASTLYARLRRLGFTFSILWYVIVSFNDFNFDFIRLSQFVIDLNIKLMRVWSINTFPFSYDTIQPWRYFSSHSLLALIISGLWNDVKNISELSAAWCRRICRSFSIEWFVAANFWVKWKL